MTNTIDETKLLAFKKALLKNPSLTDSEALEILGETEDVDAYHAELARLYPDGVTDDEPVTAAPAASGKLATKQAKPAPAKTVAVAAPAKAPAPAAAKRIVMRNPDGTTTDFQILKETDTSILIEPVRPKDVVTIMLANKPVQIDLIELRALPETDKRHGLPVGTLIILGEASKG